MNRLYLFTALLLTACNLQQQPPAPTTAAPTAEAPPAVASVTPDLRPTLLLATLQPTPTPFFLVTATLPAIPTVLNAPGGSAQPTLDAALADERYEIQVRAGATIGVNYEITIGQRGTVTLSLQGPDGLVWQQVFTASETGRAEVTIEQGGTYEILVDHERLDGSYAISWD
jgi:hypothetical protein